MSVTAGSSDRLISVSLALASSIAAAIVVAVIVAAVTVDGSARISTFSFARGRARVKT